MKDSEQINNITDLVTENADTLIHIVSTSDIIDDIPFAGSLVKLFKIGINYKEQLFAKKILRFLMEIKDISPKERTKFLDDLEKASVVENVGETLLTLLERFEDGRKATLLAKLCKAKIHAQIDEEQFFRLSHIVLNSYYPDLLKLKQFHPFHIPEDNLKASLLSLGLIWETTFSQSFEDEEGKRKLVPRCSLTQLGEDLDKIIQTG